MKLHDPCISKYRSKPKMRDKRLKIFIGVQKGITIVHATGSDQGIDRFSHRDALGAKIRKCRTACSAMPLPPMSTTVNDVNNLHAFANSLSLANPCKTSARIKSAINDGLRPTQDVEPFALRGAFAAKVVDPNTRIDQDHPSFLIASRSPSQCNLPRKRRISSCLLSLTSAIRPISTASLFSFQASRLERVPHAGRSTLKRPVRMPYHPPSCFPRAASVGPRLPARFVHPCRTRRCLRPGRDRCRSSTRV